MIKYLMDFLNKKTDSEKEVNEHVEYPFWWVRKGLEVIDTESKHVGVITSCDDLQNVGVKTMHMDCNLYCLDTKCKEFSGYELIPKKKMSLVEHVAYMELSTLEWAENFLKGLLEEGLKDNHFGNCTSQAQACHLCTLEELLTEYYEYCGKYGYLTKYSPKNYWSIEVKHLGSKKWSSWGKIYKSYDVAMGAKSDIEKGNKDLVSKGSRFRVINLIVK